MGQNAKRKVRIIEIKRDEGSAVKLKYLYSTSNYYDVSIRRKAESWTVELTLKPFEKLPEKNFETKLFMQHVEDPKVFAAELDGEQVGWIELGYHKWNNRIRVWELLVKEEFRRRGMGTLLMQHAVEFAKKKGARMLVLETQTCNVPAIEFYLKQGFELIGFDIAAYSNQDIEKKEVRLELGLKI